MKLLSEYRELHKAKKFPGLSIMQWAPDIADLVAEFQSARLLDYGCGGGFQYTRERVHNLWGLDAPTLYDPAVEAFSATLIGQFDGVICTDVLQCVPVEELDAVVLEIAGFALKWIFISVCCRASRIVFDNGHDSNVTIRPFEWWQGYLSKRFTTGARLVLRESK